ncbi:MAG: isoamylase early set domain-containing protein [Gemmatimonadaceae bacterium]
MTDWDNDPFIAKVASELKRPVRLDARFDERVMAALDEPTVIPLHRTEPRRWSDRRWTISITPLTGLAAAAAIGAIAVMGARFVASPSPAGTVAEATPANMPLVPVANAPVDVDQMIVQRQLTLLAPNAKSVAIVGDFNDWDVARGTMQRLTPDGLWSITLPLRVGRHEYQFVVDDTVRIADPTAPQSESDFGAANSVITVGPRIP